LAAQVSSLEASLILPESKNFQNWIDFEHNVPAESDKSIFLFVRYFILMSKIIPIGFIVNLETVRMFQQVLMLINHQLKDFKRNM
jgi:hypothetical protein